MKAVSFLSVAFMAASAIAAPFSGETRSVEASFKGVQRSAGNAVADNVAHVAREEKRDISDASGLISTLKDVTSSISGPLSSLKDITDSVKSGDLPKKDATAQAQPQLERIEEVLKNLVSEVTTAAGIDVRGSDLDTVVELVNTLLSELLTIVNGLVTVLGLRLQINSLVASILGLVTRLLTLLVALVPGLVGGLVAGLSPLLAGLGNGLLAPLLTPIVALLAPLQNAPLA